MGQASLLTLSFGVFFFDYDLDGLPDILAANGHLEEEINRVQPRIQYKEPPLLFRNLGKGKFASALAAVGPDFGRPMVARGAAYGDLDKNGGGKSPVPPMSRKPTAISGRYADSFHARSLTSKLLSLSDCDPLRSGVP